MVAKSFEEFCHVHDYQLKAINFPTHLKKKLYEYLVSNEPSNLKDVFDIRKTGNRRPLLLSKKDLDENNSFYLINHTWTVDCHSFLHQLKKSPALVEELASIFNISPPPDLESFYNYSSQVSSVLPLANEKSLPDVEQIVAENNGDTIHSAVHLFLGGDVNSAEDKPVQKENDGCTFEEFVKAMKTTESIPENANEAYLYKMYQNYLSRDHGSGTTQLYNWREEDDLIYVYVSVPVQSSKRSIKSDLKASSWKLQVDGKIIIDGKFYASVKPDDSYWSIEFPGLFCMSLEKVMKEKPWPELILDEDQFSPKEILTKSWVKENLEHLYQEEILDSMWKYSQTYAIASQQGSSKQPLWYVMDKYGSSLSHNKNPNFKCSPFFYAGENKAYSLLWPVQDVKVGDICTRNFIPQIISNESLNVCKTRLKAFTGKKIGERKEKSKIDVENKKLEIKIIKYEETTEIDMKVNCNYFFKTFPEESVKNITNAIPDVKLVDSNHADVIIAPLNDKLIYLEKDFLPAVEVLRNKDYLNNYLNFKLISDVGNGKEYILPNDLVEFNEEFELSDLPKYWIIKAVDKKVVDIPPMVTSLYSRIVRMCEAGSLCVSKYIVNQPSFREHRFTLTFSIVITPTKSLYIYTLPSIRHTMEKYVPNDLINEYEATNLIAPKSKAVGVQIEWYDELKVSMNKKMLLQNPDYGWQHVEGIIYEKIARLGKNLMEDIHQDSDKTFVLFAVDVMFDEQINPIVVDVDGECCLANEHSLHEIVMLTKGTVSTRFVKVE